MSTNKAPPFYRDISLTFLLLPDFVRGLEGLCFTVTCITRIESGIMGFNCALDFGTLCRSLGISTLKKRLEDPAYALFFGCMVKRLAELVGVTLVSGYRIRWEREQLVVRNEK